VRVADPNFRTEKSWRYGDGQGGHSLPSGLVLDLPVKQTTGPEVFVLQGFPHVAYDAATDVPAIEALPPVFSRVTGDVFGDGGDGRPRIFGVVAQAAFQLQ
jgi:hypothetical protein